MYAAYRAVFDQKMVLFYCIKFRKAAIVARCPSDFPGRRDRLTVAEYDEKIMPTFRIFLLEDCLIQSSQPAKSRDK